MGNDGQGNIRSTSGGAAGHHSPADPFEFLVAPTTADEFNTAHLRLIPIACFRVDDVRFKFDSSFVLPEIQTEMKSFANLRKNDTRLDGAPISIFGHADPSFQGNFVPHSSTHHPGDDYNKKLSGRRAMAIFGLLIRDPSVWEDLYGKHLVFGGMTSDIWGEDSIRIMVEFLDAQKAPPGQPGANPPPGAPNQGAADSSKNSKIRDISNDPGQRKQLFQNYMDAVCPDLKLDKSKDFLARGAGTDQKGDVQGCSRFNPLLLFSTEDETRFKTAFDKHDHQTLATDRDPENILNRRVMILVFRKGSQVLPARWPCPTVNEGTAGCIKRLFSDGDSRRSQHPAGVPRKFEETSDTFACRFYQRISDGTPCDSVTLPRPDPCKIVMADGGKIKISASELLGVLADSYSWSTASSNIKLTDSDTPTVTVEGLANPSSSRGAEIVTVVASSAGASPAARSIKITVVKLTFAPSATQRYGYDDFDTLANHLDDHVCIKNSDYTFLKVDILGGALGGDFDFVCDDPSICTAVAPPNTASFDLRLNAGATNKSHTTLRAKAKCPSNASAFSNIEVHVYKERVVEVVVAKIDNPTHTFLRFPTADYAAHGPTANAKLKEAVVKYNIANFSPTNAITPVAFASGTGVLSYDINLGGGPDLNAIRAAMTGTGTKVRVAIIRDMKSYYFLKNAAAAGATSLVFTSASLFYHPNDKVLLGTGGNQETVSITAVAGNTVTCAALKHAHAVGEGMEFPAAGWSSDPILIIEGNASLNVAKWTVLHEVGHRDRGLTLKDIVDVTDFMNWQQSWTDYRLRYCPRLNRYPAGTTNTENQWETIPRT